MSNRAREKTTETSPSSTTQPRSEVDWDISTFSRSILTPSQTHRISTEERPAGHLSLSDVSGICRETG